MGCVEIHLQIPSRRWFPTFKHGPPSKIMNPFKPKASSSSSSPEPLQGPPPVVEVLQQVFSSFQTNLSNFIRSSVKFPVLTRRRIFYKMKPEIIEKRFAGVPVYALKNSSGELVLISDSDSTKTIGLICFNKDDAVSFLEQLKSMEPTTQNDSQVVTAGLNTIVQAKVNGVSFRLIPEASQVINAIQERKISGANDDSFPGVPVFQSKNLVTFSQKKRYRLAFFRKEDFEEYKQRALRKDNIMNPELIPGNIEVAVLEDIIQGMKDDLSLEWNDIIFIPPGFDIETGTIGRKESGI